MSFTPHLLNFLSDLLHQLAKGLVLKQDPVFAAQIPDLPVGDGVSVIGIHNKQEVLV